MARPRKQAGDLFYDEFTAMSYDEQKIALRILSELHRQAERIEKRAVEEDRNRAASQLHSVNQENT